MTISLTTSRTATATSTSRRPDRRGRRAIGAVALAVSLAVSVSACGSSDDGETSQAASATEHNDADVAFATDMVQHHAQALSMVDLAVGRPLDPEVEVLVDDIRNAQSPEIETMSDWLTSWGEEVPATMRDHSNADSGAMADSMDGMDSSMPGMMSSEDMTSLEDAPDTAFQTMWLEMMLEHHTGAIEMAKAEQSDGRYQPALDLADSIVSSQSGEIDTMKDLLAS